MPMYMSYLHSVLLFIGICVIYRFEDDDDIFSDKPRSGSAPAGGRRGRTAGSFLEDMLNNDDTNWLDMASGSYHRVVSHSC